MGSVRKDGTWTIGDGIGDRMDDDDSWSRAGVAIAGS